MSRWERLLVFVAAAEIPLQLDSYLFYQEADAEFGAIAGVNISLTTLALAGLYALWLASGAARPRMERTGWTGSGALATYLGVVALSTIAARDAGLAVFQLVMLAQAFALYFYVANRVRSTRDATFVVEAFSASLALQGMLILATRYVWGARELGPLTLAMEADLRPGGTMVSPVVAGSVLALMIPPAAALATCPLGRGRRLALAAAAAIGALAVVVTQTRGAILSLGISSLAVGVGLWSRGWLPRRAPALAALVAAAALVPLVQVVRTRVTADDHGSAAARVHLAAIAASAIEEAPLLGHGAGNCHHALEKASNSGAYRSEWFYTVHCKYLLVWVETGAVGLAAFVLFLLGAVARGRRAWNAADRLLSPVALALAAAIAGQMVHMLVDVFASRTQVQMLWLVAGLVAGIDAHLHAAAATSPAARPSAFLGRGFAHAP